MTLNTAAAKHNYLHRWADVQRCLLGLHPAFHCLHILHHLHGFRWHLWIQFLAAFLGLLVACVWFGWLLCLLHLLLVEMVGVALKNHVVVQNNSMQAACCWAPCCAFWTKRRFAQQPSQRCASSAWFWTKGCKHISWYDHRDGIYLSWSTSGAPIMTFSKMSRMPGWMSTTWGESHVQEGPALHHSWSSSKPPRSNIQANFDWAILWNELLGYPAKLCVGVVNSRAMFSIKPSPSSMSCPLSPI